MPGIEGPLRSVRVVGALAIAAMLAVLPGLAAGAVTSQGMALIGADVLHGQGVRGSGVRVGVLHYGFDGYEALLGTELPTGVQTQSFRSNGSLSGSKMGTALAEIVHDLAPDADLTLASYATGADLVSALQWMPGHGVEVVVVAAAFEGWEPADGTGPVAQAANAARAAGVLVVAAAGDFGDAHYVGDYVSSSGSYVGRSTHVFGAEDVLVFGGDGVDTCGAMLAGDTIDVTLAWSDWGPNPAAPTASHDLDLSIVRWLPFLQIWSEVAYSDTVQNGDDAPVEWLTATVSVDGCYGVRVVGWGDAYTETFHLYSYTWPFATSEQRPEQSVISPCVAANVLCVGATDLDDVIEPYSSRGPSAPNEITGAQTQKPDLVAPDGVATATYGAVWGSDVSAAHVAGAAALALQLSNGDVAAAAALLRERALDLGAAGFDASYGYGRVNLEPICVDADCDDGQPCTDDHCEAGACVHGLAANDCGARQCGPSPSGCHACGTCPDGFGCGADGLCTDPCAGVTCDPCQACQGGACVLLADGADCASDANPCTSDRCVAGACVHAEVAPGAACSDGNACTAGDACTGAVCVPGPAVTCGAAAECHTGGACDPATGACVYDVSPDWTACPDDGNACTDDLCLGGTCRHNARVDGAGCEADGLACTSDTCQGGQCLHRVTNACLIEGVCQALGAVEPGNACRACQPALDVSAWTPRDGATCDDGDACTLGDACVGGACVAGTPLDCGPPTPCHQAPTCAPATGACTSAAVANGTACSDGLACTTGEACTSGACVGGQPVSCVDFDGECTVGVCREDALGCVAQPRDAGLACGEGPACSDGLWSAGGACDHSGVCVPLEAQSCAPYAACADATACATSCAGDDQCVEGSACLDAVCRSNLAPAADAGADQVAGEGATITLDGRASDDPDGDALTFTWTQVSGPGVTLDDATSDTPTFQAPTVTSAQPLVFRLVVADPWESGASDEATVTIQNTVNEAPESDAGTDVTANEGDLVTLYGTGSSDPNGDVLTYAWSVESGPVVAFEGTTASEAIAHFRAPLVNGDKAVVVKLVVNDGQVNSAPDTARVTLRDRDAPTVTDPDVQGGFEHDAGSPDVLSDDAGADASSGWTIDVGAIDAAANAAGGGGGGGSGCAFAPGPAPWGPVPTGLGVLLLALFALRFVPRRRDGRIG